MMSPRPPPPPIFPRETSLSTVSEPPRPLHATAFSSNQLPPPLQSGGVYAPRTYGGPSLAPISISASSGSAMPQQHQSAPHPQNIVPPQHSSTPYPSSTQPDANLRRSFLPDRFASPASSSTYPTPAPFPYDQRIEHAPTRGSTRRYSHEHSPEHRGERPSLTAMIPSPTYTVKRTSEELYQDDQTYPNSRFAPSTVEDIGIHRAEMPLNRSSGRYRIQVRQQPVAARACGFGERDRRVIDPPPIVQLLVNDATGRPDAASSEFRYPFNVVHCTLWSVDGTTDETALTGPDKRHTRRLMGALVSSPFVGLDEDGKEGCFFCFPDLSCRTHGRYRLRFVLMRIEATDPEGCTPIVTETMSDIFTVYTAKEFPGMRPSTSLTKALKRQGCAISVKKGNEKAIGGSGSGDEDEKVDSRSSSAPRKRIRNGDK